MYSGFCILYQFAQINNKFNQIKEILTTKILPFSAMLLWLAYFGFLAISFRLSNSVATCQQTWASRGLDSNFEGEAILESLKPNWRQGKFYKSITCLAYSTSRQVGKSKKN